MEPITALMWATFVFIWLLGAAFTVRHFRDMRHWKREWASVDTLEYLRYLNRR